MRLVFFILVSLLIHILVIHALTGVFKTENRAPSFNTTLRINLVKTHKPIKVKPKKRKAPKNREHMRIAPKAKKPPAKAEPKQEAPALKNQSPTLQAQEQKESLRMREEEQEIQQTARLSQAYVPWDTELEEEEEETEGEESAYEERYIEENLSLIRELIRSRVEYPPVARRMGWEGTVVVSFLLTPEGEIKDSTIKESSGYELLDREAIRVVSLASKDFPKPSTEVRVVIPIVYELE